jgi:hypothetical protein
MVYHQKNLLAFLSFRLPDAFYAGYQLLMNDAFKTILIPYISIQRFKRSFMGALNDLYSPSFYKNLANALVAVMPPFNKQRFVSQIFADDFNDKELKARMRHTSEVLHNFMPADYKTAANIL